MIFIFLWFLHCFFPPDYSKTRTQRHIYRYERKQKIGEECVVQGGDGGQQLRAGLPVGVCGGVVVPGAA
jgi:hypothetical protein